MSDISNQKISQESLWNWREMSRIRAYDHFCKDKDERARIPLSKTETFPPCRTCGSVRWTLVMAA